VPNRQTRGTEEQQRSITPDRIMQACLTFDGAMIIPNGARVEF
jgi:hypothetical protein